MDRCACPTVDRNPSLADPHSIGIDLTRMRRELFAHALRLARNDTLAEDLVQDTIERALRFEDRFERGTNLRAWVHQILVNVYITRCRRRRREGRALEVLATDPCAWTAPDPWTTASGDLSRATWRAIQRLPPPFRATLVLVDIQDLSYKDAADQLGVPVGTVMSRLHRARKLLAEAIGPSPLSRKAA